MEPQPITEFVHLWCSFLRGTWSLCLSIYFCYGIFCTFLMQERPTEGQWTYKTKDAWVPGGWFTYNVACWEEFLVRVCPYTPGTGYREPWRWRQDPEKNNGHIKRQGTRRLVYLWCSLLRGTWGPCLSRYSRYGILCTLMMCLINCRRLNTDVHSWTVFFKFVIWSFISLYRSLTITLK